MKTKLDMAHEYAIARLSSGVGFMTSEIVMDSWDYVDKMQAEEDKREEEKALRDAESHKTFMDMLGKQNPATEVLKFEAEKWIYERKSAYPMVDCVDGSADGFWSSFTYHPEYKGKVIYDGDIID